VASAAVGPATHALTAVWIFSCVIGTKLKLPPFIVAVI